MVDPAGRPVAGAGVSLSIRSTGPPGAPSASYGTKSDGDGGFELDDLHLPPTASSLRVELRVHGEGFAEDRRRLDAAALAAADPSRVEVVLQPVRAEGDAAPAP